MTEKGHSTKITWVWSMRISTKFATNSHKIGQNEVSDNYCSPFANMISKTKMQMPTCMNNILKTNPENSTKKRVKEEKYKEY